MSETVLVQERRTQQKEVDAEFERIVVHEELEHRLQAAEQLGSVAVRGMSEQRRETELRSLLIEGFKRHFLTKYELDYVDGHVVDEDGRAMVSFIADDYRAAQQTAAIDSRHAFYIGRSRADFENAWAVDHELMAEHSPIGTTWIRMSPYPYDQDPHAARERYYRSDTERCLVWLQRKVSDDTLELTSLAVDRKNFTQIRNQFVALGGADHVSTAEELPHHVISTKLTGAQFAELELELKNWAGIPEGLDSLEQLDRLGGDVIGRMLDQHRRLDVAHTKEDVPRSVLSIARDMLVSASKPQDLANNGIDPEALHRVLNGEFSDKERAALKQVVVVAGHASLERILASGDDQSWRQNLRVDQLMGSSGRIFIQEQHELLGCPGGMMQRFAAGRTLENWGKDTGPGRCKECKEHVEERGGCEVCVDCHIKLQTKDDVALAA